ncbi:unnamed protein product, partial [Closterium sp. NIES-54]
MLSWPLFSPNPAARFLAVAVPVANVVRILLLGTGITKNEGVVKSISREGSASELLRGPLYYVLTIVLVTTIFWRSSPVGGIALVLMCAGDGTYTLSSCVLLCGSQGAGSTSGLVLLGY